MTLVHLMRKLNRQSFDPLIRGIVRECLPVRVTQEGSKIDPTSTTAASGLTGDYARRRIGLSSCHRSRVLTPKRLANLGARDAERYQSICDLSSNGINIQPSSDLDVSIAWYEHVHSRIDGWRFVPRSGIDGVALLADLLSTIFIGVFAMPAMSIIAKRA